MKNEKEIKKRKGGGETRHPETNLVLVLVLVLPVGASASSTFALSLTLAFASSLRFPLAFLALALASGTSTATLGITFQLDQQALLVVALILVVLALATEGAGDCTPAVVRHLSLPTSVGLLLLALDHEPLMLVAVRGMDEAALLVSGFTPEEVLHTAHS